jgi:hypothetical protein
MHYWPRNEPTPPPCMYVGLRKNVMKKKKSLISFFRLIGARETNKETNMKTNMNTIIIQSAIIFYKKE